MTERGGETLAGIGLLSGLTDDEREKVQQACRWKRFKAQEQIIDRQSDTQDVFFVAEGRARVVNYSLSGREITLNDVSMGEHFGELAAIDGEPRSASVMALEDTTIAALPRDRFLDLLRDYPEIALNMMRDLATMVRSSTVRIMDLSTLAANNRVQADLLREARSRMVADNEAEISPIPVHGDIASRVSTTRETVARVLGELSREGIVERLKDKLVIRDMNRLEQMVENVRGE